jgi:hypothetical protein
VLSALGLLPARRAEPDVVVGHVRDCLALDRRTIPDGAERTAEWQRELVRERVGAVFDPERARGLAEGAIRAAAGVKNHPHVLSAAAHAALGRGAPARPWIACGAACDDVDLTLTLLDRVPRGAAVLVGALAGNGAAMAAALER